MSQTPSNGGDDDWRLTLAGVAPTRQTPNLPRWDGSDPAGKKLLVCCGPNLGDCIQLVRYIPLLQGRGADVVLSAPRPLTSILKSLPDVRVIADDDPRCPAVDCHVSLCSLPLIFATTAATIPTFNAYLRAPQRFALRRRGSRPTLGLCVDDAPQLAPPLAAAASDRFAVTIVPSPLHDLTETATAIAPLDLLIATE